jgi:putative radical SAM enzyme (TIGR03279 family)
MVEITGVLKGTPAARHGIRVGDKLIAINGNLIVDVLDYRYYLCEKKLVLSLCRDGEEFSVNIKKGEYDDIGLEFETFLMDKKHSCRNKCIFCFIDQLPRGMRDTLYFKDDDSRLSFLQGNYITMTNLSDEDVERIIKMKMSPINISVHTTNPELRVKMLKNPNAAKSLDYLRRFAEAGTEIGCQIVLCRGINDGEELARSMHDLAAYYPAVKSVSIVPAGMTRFREEKGLYPLTPFTKEEAAAVVKQVETFAEYCLAAYGTRIFYVGDELYLEAGLPIPDADYYEEFHQLEDGVGMIASTKQEFFAALEDADADDRAREISIATGVAAYPLMCELSEALTKKYPNIKIHVYEIKNHYFGELVTVAGLVTGKDLLEQLKGKPLGEALYITQNMLRHEGDLFLCGMSIDELSESLGVEICQTSSDGYDVFDALLGNAW